MSYDYTTQRPNIFTERGQVLFMRIRDAAKAHVKASGAVMSDRLIAAGLSGDVWDMLACVDRLVELGELIEIPNPTSSAGQHRIFIGPYR